MQTKLERDLLPARYLAEIITAGYDFEVCQDFERVSRIAGEAGRTFQMPGFDPRRVDHTQGQTAWFFLTHDGENVGTLAGMVQPLGVEGLSSYLKRVYQNQFPKEGDDTIVKVSPLLDAISGRLLYIGELNIRREHRGKRRLLSSFMRLSMHLCQEQWNPDWVYAFIPHRHIMARLDLVYGFARSYQRAVIWSKPEPETRKSSEWFVGASRDELSHLIAQGPDISSE